MWRFACALLFSVLIIAVLHSYSGGVRLGPWDRRVFNTATILFSSLVSLSLGSLLGLLGSMIRWPLLAMKYNTPRDVDLLLGMPSLTGSLKLILHHSWNGQQWSRTTWIVLLYLLINLVGRLSVAVFGLTYDLNKEAGVEYPVMVNSFETNQWLYVHEYTKFEENLGMYELVFRRHHDELTWGEQFAYGSSYYSASCLRQRITTSKIHRHITYPTSAPKA